MTGPLQGLRVALLGGIGPAPFCAMLLADLGADVIRIERADTPADDPLMGTRVDVLGRGQRGVALDLKSTDDIALARQLIDQAEVVLEGFRPGALERLGLGPDDCLARNPRLVFARITGWGQTGPLAQVPGHDIDFIALTGALDQVGTAGGPPVPALNLLADFAGGGLMTAYGVLAAVLHARQSGQGQVIDSAMFEGVNTLMTLQHALADSGRHRAARGENLLDGGAPFNAVYRCADGRYLAVGSVEPPFYRALLTGLALDQDAFMAPQDDRSRWPEQKARIAAVLATATRDNWIERLAASPCCVAPVLSLHEAPAHAHVQARNSFLHADGLAQPVPAPRFSHTVPTPPVAARTHTDGGDAIRASLAAGQWPSR